MGFQVSKHLVECHTDEPSNVFNEDDTGSHDRKDSINFRPEVTVIFRAESLPGVTERLARDSAGNNVNWSPLVTLHLSQIVQSQRIRPVLRQNTATPGVNLDMTHHLPAHPGRS